MMHRIHTAVCHRVRCSSALHMVLWLALLWAHSVSAQSFAVRQVRVFDGDRVHAGLTVIVRDGVIASVSRDTLIPPGVDVVDGTGYTLLPGLFESHGHTGPDAEALIRALSFGVTTVLDMGTRPTWAAERRHEQRSGVATGRADLLSAGTVVSAQANRLRPDQPTISTPDEAAGAVKRNLEEGSDYIKIIYQPCGRCVSIDSATLRAVIAEAHRRNRKAVVHANTLEDARTAIEGGADGIAHLFADQVADTAFLTLIAEREAFVVPTLSVTAVQSGRRDAGALLAHPAFWQYLTGDEIKNMIANNPGGNRNPRFQWDSVSVSLKLLADRRVPILAGSDAPNTGTAWGAGMHRELELMVEAGMSPIAALQAATSVPARVFGLNDRGGIAPGLRADLLLVEGDPTENILASRNIVGIWKEGVRFDRERHRPLWPVKRP